MSGRFLEGWEELEDRFAKGMLNLVLFIEAKAKMNFQDVGGPLPRPPSAPGESPVVQTGNLRRSIHSVVIYEGKTIGGTSDENGAAIPQYEEVPDRVVGYVGTNSGYGLYVEAGTSKMGERPFLTPAGAEGMAKQGDLIQAGMHR